MCRNAAGGGPGQQPLIRFDVRLSEKLPHVSHHSTVPALMIVCLLPLPTKPCSLITAAGTTQLILAVLHLEVASLAHDVDLLLQRVQIQQWPDRASSTECPPSHAGTTGFACLGPLFLLPSTPAFLSAFFL